MKKPTDYVLAVFVGRDVDGWKSCAYAIDPFSGARIDKLDFERDPKHRSKYTEFQDMADVLGQAILAIYQGRYCRIPEQDREPTRKAWVEMLRSVADEIEKDK